MPFCCGTLGSSSLLDGRGLPEADDPDCRDLDDDAFLAFVLGPADFAGMRELRNFRREVLGDTDDEPF